MKLHNGLQQSVRTMNTISITAFAGAQAHSTRKRLPHHSPQQPQHSLIYRAKFGK